MVPRPPLLTHEPLAVEAGALPLTVVRGDGAGAAVVIVPSAFGVNADLEAQMLELASDARLLVSYDPFFREDPGVVPYDDLPRVLRRVGGADRARALRDYRAVLDWVRREAGDVRVIHLGICFGGPFGLLAAAEGWVDGVVTWHGSRMEAIADRAPRIRCPVRLHFGDADPVVPMAAVEALRAAFAGHPDAELVVHPGATHGFSQRRASASYSAPAERAGMAALRALVTAR